MRSAINGIVVGLMLGMARICPAGWAEPAVDPKIWEKDIAAFEAMDRMNPPPKNAVLFLGSSTIRYWTNLSNAFPELTLIRRGFGGAHLPDLTYYAERIVFPYEPSKIVMYAGDNDIAKGRSPGQVLADFREFVGKVQAKLPRTKIYFMAIKPSPSRWHLSPQGAEANRLVRNFCRFRPKVEFIDLWTPTLKDGRPNSDLFERDRLHVNAAGYAAWTPIIHEALED